MPRTLRLELHRLAVENREGLRKIAIGAGGEADLRPAWSAQVAGGAFFGARRQAGVGRVEIGDGKIAGDGRELRGGKAVVAAPEPQEPLAHELWLEAKNCSPENQRSAERKQRPAQGPHGKSLRQIDGLRRSGSANVQQGQELDRWGPHPGVWRSLRRLGRELDAGSSSDGPP